MLLTELGSLAQTHFRLLEKLSPKSASKKGVRLWLTPPRYQPSMSEEKTLATASIKRIPFEGSNYQSSPETYYIMYTWGQGKPILLLHDWGGSAAQVSPLVSPLLLAGFKIVSIDALAHGASPGSQTDLSELTQVIKNLAAKCGDFHAIFAHSCSAIAAVMALSDGIQCSRLVISNTAASIDYYLKRFFVSLKASRETMGRISASLNVGLRRNVKDFSIINLVPQIDVPTLLIHDNQNQLIHHTEAIALSKLWPNCKLLLTRGLGHDGILSDPETISKIIDYIQESEAVPNASKVN